MIEIVIALLIIDIILILLLVRYYKKYKTIFSGKMSQSSIYGKTIEQLMPFVKDFPFPPERFRFIGNPIDGVAFLDDRVVFVEMKFNKSELSPVQKKIKDAVQKGRVGWVTVRTASS